MDLGRAFSSDCSEVPVSRQALAALAGIPYHQTYKYQVTGIIVGPITRVLSL
jgi:hypothetical protein